MPPEQGTVTASQRIDIALVLIDIRTSINRAALDGEPVCPVIPLLLAHTVMPEHSTIAYTHCINRREALFERQCLFDGCLRHNALQQIANRSHLRQHAPLTGRSGRSL